MKQEWMTLKILLPTEVFLETEVQKIVAEAGNGFFGILPRHIDFVTALVPGIFTYWDVEGREYFIALDAGLFVKCGQSVLVSARNAVRGDDLDKLVTMIEETFCVMDERARTARDTVAKMEADLVRRLVALT